jgi:hypothetical protein
VRLLAALVLVVLALWFLLTSSAPMVPERPAPTAADVGAGRDAYRQIRGAKGSRSGKLVVLGPAQLDALGALASHGFRPDRLTAGIDGPNLRVEGSHRLWPGRWLNVTLVAEGPSTGFPRTRLKIGALNLPPLLSRWALETGRWLLHLRTPDVPPLDTAVRNFSVQGGNVTALMSLPGHSGLVDDMAGAVSQSVDKSQVLRVYCALEDRQRKQPSGDFAEQVRRAFLLDPQGASRFDFNRAAFVALGMLLVDERIADFADLKPEEIGHCRTAAVPTSIYGRSDWPKHWILSAAISVGAGVQLSEAMGEWKELADSLAKESQFAIGDPSGFSMADLGADRAGFRTARAASEANSADRLADELAHAQPEQLLPHALVEREDGLSNAEFVRRYGGIDDPRFKARVGEIDAVIDRAGLH